ncbi:MAG TPA: hypothetical protein VF753_08555 [Terriglobales bacterium]
MAAAQHGQAAASAPVIRFTLDFPASDPTHYEISMAADGRGSYSSRYRTEDAGAGTASGSDGAGHGATEVYESEFAAPAASAGRIFDLAKQAHYFSGKVDTGDKHLAFTGTKTLAYEAQGQSTRASYNYSPVAAVDELTDIFQDMSACLEFGRRLEYDFRFQKLAMEEVLKQMEDEVNEGRLKQQAVIAPMLQKIVDDQAAMKVSRARAQRILAKAGK